MYPGHWLGTLAMWLTAVACCHAAPALIDDFHAAPTEVQAGEPVKIAFNLAKAGPGADDAVKVEITTPYRQEANAALAGFEYDAATHKAYRRPAFSAGPMTVELPTDHWPAGVHLLQFDVLNGLGKVVDSRNFAVKVYGPNDRLRATVGKSWYFGPGTHFSRFLKLRNGVILCQEKLSRDGGHTWEEHDVGFGAGGEELRDGTIFGMEYRCLPVEDCEGWYKDKAYLSTDGGASFTERRAWFHVPEAKAARGHAMHLGPLFMRSIVERKDGSLAALMAGWFKCDTAECPYGKGRPYSRSYVCESSDRGKTWRYLTTIGCGPIGSEGYNEGAMRRLSNGEFLAVLRTGNETDLEHFDNPIMWSVSDDEGRTWSAPQRTGVDGAFPDVAVLSDGTLVMCYGRPGAMLVFSADNGRTWTDPTCVDAQPVSGYTDVVELGPGKLLCGFGVRRYLDPATGIRDNQLRLAEVCYQRK